MQINIFELNKTKGGTDFSYNDEAEVAITKAVCEKYNIIHYGGTKGFDPRYDQILNETTTEIKITKNKNPYIEFIKDTGILSGIYATESNIHLLVCPGSIQQDGCWIDIVKVRAVKTMELKRWVDFMIDKHDDQAKLFEADNLGKGSAGFYLDWNAVDDLFLLGFEYEVHNLGHIMFNTNKIIMPSNNYAYTAINDYIPT